MHSVPRIVLLLLVASWLACDTSTLTDTPTQVTFQVEVPDPALRQQATELRFLAAIRTSSGAWREPDVRTISTSGLLWPVDVPVFPRDARDADQSFDFVVEVLEQGTVLAQGRVVARFSQGERESLPLRVYSCAQPDGTWVCAPVSCRGETCDVCTAEGTCEAAGVSEAGTTPVDEPDAAVSTQPDTGSIAVDVDDDAATDSSASGTGASQDASATVDAAPSSDASSASDAGGSALDASMDARAPVDANGPMDAKASSDATSDSGSSDAGGATQDAGKDAGSDAQQPAKIAGTAVGCLSYTLPTAGRCGGYYCGVREADLQTHAPFAGPCGTLTAAEVCADRLPEQVGKCSEGMLGASENNRQQMVSCIQGAGAAFARVPGACLNCYIDAQICASKLENCLTTCLGNRKSPACDKCRLDKGCDQPVPTCTGFPSPF